MGVDLIGSGDKIVALVEVEEGSVRKMEDVVREITAHNKNVRSVLQRTHGTEGKFRLREQKLVWGGEDTEVVHREYGYVLKLDPRFVYFSPRESTIRRYISSHVRPGEKILVMFAGVGPYAICMSKMQPEVGEIVAVEANPKAVEYMRENVRVNKVSHLVTPVEGDVEDFCAKSDAKFDRIVMPMVNSKDFLGIAADAAKKGGVVYVYMVSGEDRLFKDCEEFISDAFEKLKVRYEVRDMRKISLYAPGKWKVLMEIIVK